MLAAVCDAFMPALDPGPGHDPALFRLSAAQVDLASAVEHAMTGGALSGRQLNELRLLLRLYDNAAFMLIAAGRFARFTQLDRDARERALVAMSRSIIPQVRTGFQALKRLSSFLFYSVTPGGRVSPTWAPMGYALPGPSKTRTAALTLTRITKPTTLEADACVIGAGAGGGVVAERLANAGLTVVVLEAGPPDQAPDYDRREIAGIQRLYYEQGTTATRDLGVSLLAGRGLGGGTSINWQTSLRLPDVVRDEWATRSGVRALAEEPFTRALDAVCERAGVGTTESIRNANNEALARGCQLLGYRWSTIPRNSHGCDLVQCGYCTFGCSVGGKQSTAVTFLADAQRGGRTTIVADCASRSVVIEGGRAAGVRAVARDSTGAMHDVRVNARIVVVSAGSLETPALLLRSGVRHPQLGRNLLLHPATAVAGRYRETIRGWIGPPQTVLCDELAALNGTYGVRLESAPVHPGLMALAHAWHGARAHREQMQALAHVSAVAVISRDRHGGRVTVDREGRPVIDYRVGRMERSLLQRGIAAAARVHWAAGAQEVHTLHTSEQRLRRSAASTSRDLDAFCERVSALPVHANHCAVFSAHQMGTCRMGADPKRDVCDARGGVYGVPGLFVADGSLFPASSGVNPMITIMALAYMVGDAIVRDVGRSTALTARD